MIATNTFPSPQRPNNSTFPPTHNYQQNQLFHHNQESQLQIKSQQLRVQIRNNQINRFKEERRQQMLAINLIEEMIDQLPIQNNSTHSWAYQLMRSYGQIQKYKLSPDRVVELFKLVEKFPNKLTLQLLEVIFVRADLNSINNIFQYDVMKLLHSVITYTSNYTSQTLNRSFSSEESQTIIKEAVINEDAVRNIAKSVQMLNQANNIQKIILVRTVIRIISQICRKGEHVRNFAVINHKTYTYCLKAYKMFGKQIKTEFFTFLQAASYQKFQHHDEQFQRIANKIISLFFSESIDLQTKNCSNNKYMIDCELLTMAFANILAKKSSWISIKIKVLKNSSKNYNILQKIMYILRNYLSFAEEQNLVESKPGKLLTETINLSMRYIEGLESDNRIVQYHGMIQREQICWTKQKIQAEIIYFEMISILRTCINTSLSKYIKSRTGIYFTLTNHFCDFIPEDILYSLFIFDPNSTNNNLLTLLTNLLIQQTDTENQRQICNCINSIFRFLPVQLIEPLIVPSQVLQIAMTKIIELTSWCGDGSEQICVKSLLLDAIHTFFQRYGAYLGVNILNYKDMLLGQFGHQLTALSTSIHCQNGLGLSLSNFVSYLQNLDRQYACG